MRSLKMLVFAMGTCALSFSVFAQGSFHNLNFESGKTTPTQSGGSVLTSVAMPGWSVYYGGTQVSSITPGYVTLDSPNVSIIGTDFTMWNALIDGNYSACLQSGQAPLFSGITTVSIDQTALMPADAQTLLFKASNGALGVSFNGNNLNYFAVGSGANYVLYAANISSYADQYGTLQFSSPLSGSSLTFLDDIKISAIAVPEPSTLALGLIGACAFLSRKLFNKTQVRRS
jgi:hypothetical protein